MKHIIAFAGSTSKNSINKQLAAYVSGVIQNVKTTVLDLNDFELPLYSVDLESKDGIPDNAKQFLKHLKTADGIILSLAEHNGAYSSAFKNIFDWISRLEKVVWGNTPMLLMATSPGGRGGATVLEIAKNSFPHMGGNIVAHFSLPSFHQNFSEAGITNPELNTELNTAILSFESAITIK